MPPIASISVLNFQKNGKLGLAAMNGFTINPLLKSIV